MNEYLRNAYILPLGTTRNEGLSARVRGDTLYLYAEGELLGYTIPETPSGRSVQRTIDDFLD
jgi:hypothetical protein